MAWVHEQRTTRQLSWASICSMFKTRFKQSIGVQSLPKYYHHAMTHGFSAWTDYPEGDL